MAARPFKSLLPWLSSTTRKRKSGGFTLAELLVGMVIASLITSGLIYLVKQILEASQTESSQTQTQQEMQSALDLISSELREAIYVYDGRCIQGVAPPTTPDAYDTYCPGIVNHININISNHLANSQPVLAFWKLDPLPPVVRTQCRAGTPPTGVAPSTCNGGKTYTLVVYFLRKNQPSDNPKWSGKARITRHQVTQFVNNTTTLNTFFVPPEQPGVGFQFWPYKLNTGGSLSNQQPTGQPATEPDTLVDFVDDTIDTAPTCLQPPGDNPLIITDDVYILTPTTAPFGRSLYACVRSKGAANQDVFIFLRGNSSGKAGVSNNLLLNPLPTLQTQVLNRGVVDKTPFNY